MQAELRQVPWSELPQRVADRLIPREELGVAGCPTDIALRPPDRRVVQYIENVFYSWEEYDLTAVQGQSFCVVMRRPVDQVLTAGEAQVLLTASGLWLEPWLRSAEAASLAADHPDLQRAPVDWRGDASEAGLAKPAGPDRGLVGWAASGETPVEEGKPRPGPAPGIGVQTGGSVIGGTDERTRVPNTNAFPHGLIAYLSFDTSAPNGNPAAARATGFLVSPYMALTNGHVVWDDVRRQFSRNLVIAPGQSEAGGAVSRPFGTRTAVRLATNPGWVETAKIQYD
jgi:hypothetical protein